MKEKAQRQEQGAKKVAARLLVSMEESERRAEEKRQGPDFGHHVACVAEERAVRDEQQHGERRHERRVAQANQSMEERRREAEHREGEKGQERERLQAMQQGDNQGKSRRTMTGGHWNCVPVQPVHQPVPGVGPHVRIAPGEVRRGERRQDAETADDREKPELPAPQGRAWRSQPSRWRSVEVSFLRLILDALDACEVGVLGPEGGGAGAGGGEEN